MKLLLISVNLYHSLELGAVFIKLFRISYEICMKILVKYQSSFSSQNFIITNEMFQPFDKCINYLKIYSKSSFKFLKLLAKNKQFYFR